MVDTMEARRRHAWVDQIIGSLDLGGYDYESFGGINNQKLQYLARRSIELSRNLDDVLKSGADSSMEFKARKLMKRMKDSLTTMLH